MTPMTAAGKTAGVSDLLGGWTCNQAKDATLNTPQKLFSMWAQERILGDGSGIADQISKRGNINLMLSKLADITTAIQILEEAVAGSPKKVAEIFTNWAMGKALTVIGSGIPGAVWTVAKGINEWYVFCLVPQPYYYLSTPKSELPEPEPQVVQFPYCYIPYTHFYEYCYPGYYPHYGCFSRPRLTLPKLCLYREDRRY